MVEIREYLYQPIQSKMYIVVENGSALIIDPNVSDDAKKYLDTNCVKDVLIVLTHEHCDHITGVNWLKEKYNVKVLCSQKCAERIKNSHMNLSSFYDVLIDENEWDCVMQPFVCSADITFEQSLQYKWKSHLLSLQETPGHSEGSICILMDNQYFFTGDSLIPGLEVVTKLPGGSKKKYYEITKPYLDSVINDSIRIMAGHAV